MKKKIFTLIIITSFLFANAQYVSLYNLASSSSDGMFPRGSLVSDGTFLYGMTHSGGSSTFGTIFKVKPNGTGYLRLMSFAGGSNGRDPFGSLIFDGTFLYGMTSSMNNTMGTIFKILPTGTGYVKLLDFNGALNGSNPRGSLIFDGTFLYGMTSEGGAGYLGVIFKIKPDGTGYVKLKEFMGNLDGQYPHGSLVSDGTFLYGMTSSGGTNSVGTIFKIMPDGTGYSKILDFSGTINGGTPYGSLIFDGTYLYGMTRTGGTTNTGVIFKIMPNGTGYSKIFDFALLTTGMFPYGDLISTGNFLYGMTREGGINNDGALFKIKADGTGFTKLLDFGGSGYGINPDGSLIYDGSALYGMTSLGGQNSCGKVFKYSGIVNVDENMIENDFIISPNPSNGEFSIQITGSSANNQYKIEVYNVLSQIVFQKTVSPLGQMLNGVNNTHEIINLSSEPNGIYHVFVKTKDGSISKKLVINN